MTRNEKVKYPEQIVVRPRGDDPTFFHAYPIDHQENLGFNGETCAIYRLVGVKILRIKREFEDVEKIS